MGTWKEDIGKIVDGLPENFTLEDVNINVGRNIPKIVDAHPNNNNINAKIRQVLQQLRDDGKIRFLGKGKYQRVP